MGMSLSFTETAKQVPVPQDETQLDAMLEDSDYHLFDSSDVKNFPHAYTSVDTSLMDADGRGFFYAPVNNSLTRITLPYGSWGMFRDEMATFFAKSNLSAVHTDRDVLCGRTLFFHLMDFSDNRGVMDTFAVRALAMDFRVAARMMGRKYQMRDREFTSLLRSKDPMLFDVWQALRVGILSTARVGGVVVVG